MSNKVKNIIASIVCICLLISIPILICKLKGVTDDNAHVVIPLSILLSILFTHTIAGEIYLQTGFLKCYFYNILGWDEEVTEYDWKEEE